MSAGSPVPVRRSARIIGRGGRSSLGTAVRACIYSIDWLLRRWYGVYEYSRTNNDLLRMSVGVANTSLTLPDGTRIISGDPIIDLHIWNERVPALGAIGPNLVWATRVRFRLERSLAALAKYLDQHDDLDHCVAVRAVAIFIGTRVAGKVTRLAGRYGLTPPLEERPADLGHGLLAFGLAWACNPDSLVGKRLRPIRYELWMSTQALREQYLTGPGSKSEAVSCREGSGTPPLNITAAC